MFRKVMKQKVFCGLDVGTKTLKAALIKVENNNQKEILALSDQKTYGIKDSAISNLSEVSECIQKVLDELLKMNKAKFKIVNIGINASLVNIRRTTSVIPLLDKNGKIISARDIDLVNNNAKLIGMKLEEEVLHNLPEYYIVNDDNQAINPTGLYAKKLGVVSLLAITNVNFLRNLTRAVNQAGYEVDKITFNDYSASDVVLSEDDKKEGVLLIDIGSQITSLVFFKDGVFKFLEKISIGSDNFTLKIAEKLNLNFDLAEEIKKTYAIASSSEKYSQEEILIKRENNYYPIKRELIYQAIEGEIYFMIEAIKEIIVKNGIASQINKGITFIGGGSLLPGLIEKIGAEVKHTVKLGKATGISYKNIYKGPSYASAIGIASSGINKGLIKKIISSEKTSAWQQAVNRFKELYFEYF